MSGKIAFVVVIGLIGSAISVLLYNWHKFPDFVSGLFFLISWIVAVWIYKSLS